jgi:hypothetical protein
MPELNIPEHSNILTLARKLLMNALQRQASEL